MNPPPHAQAPERPPTVIRDQLADDFAALQEAIWAIYTPEQRAWIEAHKPAVCDRNGPPRLTEEQIAKIRALKEAFQEAIADEMATIKAAHQEARAAKAAPHPGRHRSPFPERTAHPSEVPCNDRGRREDYGCHARTRSRDPVPPLP